MPTIQTSVFFVAVGILLLAFNIYSWLMMAEIKKPSLTKLFIKKRCWRDIAPLHV